MNTPLTQDQLKKIKELKALGLGNVIIAKMVGCNRNTVLYHTNENYKKKCLNQGVRKKGQRLEPDLVKSILEMCKEGMSSLAISRKTGVNYATILRYKNPKKRIADIERSKKYPKTRSHSAIAKDERGGKCELCGFDKHYNCLDFHHKIPSNKQFSISQASRKKIEEVRVEAAKCILVCKNCHALIHAGVVEIPLDC